MTERPLPNSRRFSTTMWSEVVRAGQPNTEAGQEALAALLEKYRRPLLRHLVRVRRWEEAAAEDLLHDFIHDKVMVKGLIRRARKARGKFRTFLLSALDTFMKEKLRNDNRQKRRPAAGFVPLDDVHTQGIAARGDTPTEIFDVEWARAVLSETLRLMESECRSKSQENVWLVFRSRVLRPILDGEIKADYEELIREGGFESPAEVSTALTTGKRKFTRILKEDVIGEYAVDEAAAEAEYRELHAILSKSS